MSITLTGTGGLFTRMGRFGKVANDMRTYQATTLPGNIESLMEQFESAGWREYVANVPQADLTSRQAVEQIMTTLAAAAKSALIAQVAADRPSAGGSLGAALVELIRQMNAATATVQACSVAASTAARSNIGNGVIVVSAKRGDGLVQEQLYPEVAPVLCSNDAQTGSATAGQEQFSYVGAIAESDVWAYDYPIGSGVTTTLNAIDATQSASGGNILTNSNFELFTTNLPNQWVAAAGTAGTDFQESTAQFYDGAASLQFVGGGTAPSLTQQLDNSAGTTGIVTPLASYAVNVALKLDVVPAAGVLTIDLIDGGGTVIQDAQGNDNSFAVTLSGLTTSWAFSSGIFRMPAALPSAMYVRVRLSTGLSSGSNLFIDHLGMGPLTRLYTGGPGAAIFSGNINFISGDGWDLTTTNDFGGSSNLSTFQWLFDRLFGMRSLGLLLPSTASSPTIADTLITS